MQNKITWLWHRPSNFHHYFQRYILVALCHSINFESVIYRTYCTIINSHYVLSNSYAPQKYLSIRKYLKHQYYFLKPINNLPCVWLDFLVILCIYEPRLIVIFSEFHYLFSVYWIWHFLMLPLYLWHQVITLRLQLLIFWINMKTYKKTHICVIK